MPDDVIERVHALARCQKANPGLVFLDHNQVPDGGINEHDDDDTDDDEDDSDYVPGEDDDDSVSEQDDDEPNNDDDHDSDDDSDYYPAEDGEEVDTESLAYDSEDGSVESEAEHPPGGGDDAEGIDAANGTAGAPEEADHIAAREQALARAGAPEEEAEVADDGRTTGVDAEVTEDTGTTGVNAEDTGTTGVDAEDDSQAALAREMEEKYGPQTERYNMQQRCEPDYSHLFANTHMTDEPLATPQRMNMKKGLKVLARMVSRRSRKRCYSYMTGK
jgi:hypothetical protein